MSSRAKLRLAIAVLLLLHLGVIFAGFLAPYDFAEQHRDLVFAPPSRIHFVDTAGKFQRPFVYDWQPRPGSYTEYAEDTAHPLPIRFFVKTSASPKPGFGLSGRRLFGVDDPGHIFLLGTDAFGRDQLSRLLHGGRVSLFAGLLAAMLSLAAGMLLGGIAGFYGRFTDDLVMRLAELFLALPWLYLLLATRAFLPLQLGPQQAFLLLVTVFGLVGWARPARLIRGIVLSAKERGYVTAARGFGASDFYLLRRHILPQTYGVVLTQAAILVPQYILAEVTLSFLGLGVNEPAPSWGNMLGELQQYHVLASYWWMLVPALVLVPTFIAYNVTANCVQERVQSTH